MILFLFVLSCCIAASVITKIKMCHEYEKNMAQVQAQAAPDRHMSAGEINQMKFDLDTRTYVHDLYPDVINHSVISDNGMSHLKKSVTLQMWHRNGTVTRERVTADEIRGHKPGVHTRTNFYKDMFSDDNATVSDSTVPVEGSFDTEDNTASDTDEKTSGDDKDIERWISDNIGKIRLQMEKAEEAGQEQLYYPAEDISDVESVRKELEDALGQDIRFVDAPEKYFVLDI